MKGAGSRGCEARERPIKCWMMEEYTACASDSSCPEARGGIWSQPWSVGGGVRTAAGDGWGGAGGWRGGSCGRDVGAGAGAKTLGTRAGTAMALGYGVVDGGVSVSCQTNVVGLGAAGERRNACRQAWGGGVGGVRGNRGPKECGWGRGASELEEEAAMEEVAVAKTLQGRRGGVGGGGGGVERCGRRDGCGGAMAGGGGGQKAGWLAGGRRGQGGGTAPAAAGDGWASHGGSQRRPLREDGAADKGSV